MSTWLVGLFGHGVQPELTPIGMSQGGVGTLAPADHDTPERDIMRHRAEVAREACSSLQDERASTARRGSLAMAAQEWRGRTISPEQAICDGHGRRLRYCDEGQPPLWPLPRQLRFDTLWPTTSDTIPSVSVPRHTSCIRLRCPSRSFDRQSSEAKSNVGAHRPTLLG